MFIAFDRLLQEATQGHEINVYQSVHIIRGQRPNMVANLVCYLALQVNLIKYVTNYDKTLLHITYLVFIYLYFILIDFISRNNIYMFASKPGCRHCKYKKAEH